jgi:hypothetical protein
MEIFQVVQGREEPEIAFAHGKGGKQVGEVKVGRGVRVEHYLHLGEHSMEVNKSLEYVSALEQVAIDGHITWFIYHLKITIHEMLFSDVQWSDSFELLRYQGVEHLEELRQVLHMHSSFEEVLLSISFQGGRVHLEEYVADVTIGRVDETLVDESDHLLLLAVGEESGYRGAVEYLWDRRDLVAVLAEDGHSIDVEVRYLPFAIQVGVESHLSQTDCIVQRECISVYLVNDSSHNHCVSLPHLNCCLKLYFEVLLYLHFEESLHKHIKSGLAWI